MTSITERLEQCYTGVVHDVMRAMGLTDFTLPPSLRPDDAMRFSRTLD